MINFSYKKIISLFLILVMVFSLNLGGLSILAQEVEAPVKATADEAPEGYESENTAITNTFSEHLKSLSDGTNILLIEDVNPWNVTAHHTILKSFGSVKKISSANAPLEEFSNYDLVILSNDQNAITYANYENYRANLEKYIYAGGVVIFGNAYAGWNYPGSSSKRVYKLPYGVSQTFVNQRTSNKIASPKHPIVTAVLTNNVALTNQDLNNPGGVSYSKFNDNTIPVSGSVIIRDSSAGATLIEYPYGRGTVIATDIVWEFDLVYNNGVYAKKALKDLYAYALSRSSTNFTFDISSAVVEPGESVDITVSMRNNPGIAGLDFDFKFENLGNMANVKPVSITPLNDFRTGIFSSNLDALNSGADLDWNIKDTITVTWSNADNIVTENSAIFTIRFDISKAAKSGVYSLDLKGKVINEYYDILDYGRRPGSITIYRDDPNDFLYGDTHYNNVVEIKDATRLAQYLVNKVALSLYETRAANVYYDLTVNEENIINIKDAIKLSQWLADYDGIILGHGPSGVGPGRKPTK